MIITRSPLRVSLAGGGTDLPSYSSEYGGFLIAGAIDKYVYINAHSRFVDDFLLKYSHLEEAASIDDIRHPIIREALRLLDVRARNLEITSMAGIPAGTGLGSSGSFVTGNDRQFAFRQRPGRIHKTCVGKGRRIRIRPFDEYS